jgi:hypothetical protein
LITVPQVILSPARSCGNGPAKSNPQPTDAQIDEAMTNIAAGTYTRSALRSIPSRGL